MYQLGMLEESKRATDAAVNEGEKSAAGAP